MSTSAIEAGSIAMRHGGERPLGKTHIKPFMTGYQPIGANEYPSMADQIKAEQTFKEEARNRRAEKIMHLTHYDRKSLADRLPVFTLTPQRMFVGAVAGTAVVAMACSPVPPTIPAADQTPRSFLPNVPSGSQLPPKEIPTPDAPKPLPTVISSKSLENAGINLGNQTIEEIDKMQQEALEKGFIKPAVPGKFLTEGGKIEAAKSNPNGDTGLFFTKPKPGPFEFPSLVSGEVAKITFSTVNIIDIRFGPYLVGFFTASDHRPLVKQGDRVTVGHPIFSGTFDPNSEAQQRFENMPVHWPSGTVVAVGVIKEDNTVFSIDLTSILRGAGGELVSVGTPGK